MMSQHRPNIAAELSDQGKRVLLVLDNNAHFLCYLSVLLERLDYHVYPAMTAKDALEALAAFVPSLIITSLNIKDMDSLHLMQLLKQSPVVGAVPFITLARQGYKIEKVRSLRAGAVDCIEQPFSTERLYQAIEKIVGPNPRTNIRVRTTQPVKVNDGRHDAFYGAYTLDLSERGMFLRTASPVSAKTQFNCQIHLYNQIIEVDAAVLYSNRINEGVSYEPGMGVEFVQIDPKDQHLIRRFIMSEVMRGITLGNG